MKNCEMKIDLQRFADASANQKRTRRTQYNRDGWFSVRLVLFPTENKKVSKKDPNLISCEVWVFFVLFPVRFFRNTEKLAGIEGFLPKCRQADHESAKISNKGDQRL